MNGAFPFQNESIIEKSTESIFPSLLKSAVIDAPPFGVLIIVGPAPPPPPPPPPPVPPVGGTTTVPVVAVNDCEAIEESEPNSTFTWNQ